MPGPFSWVCLSIKFNEHHRTSNERGSAASGLERGHEVGVIEEVNKPVGVEVRRAVAAGLVVRMTATAPVLSGLGDGRWVPRPIRFGRTCLIRP